MTRVHLQNEYAKRVEYWEDREELPNHVFRKAHQRRRYDERVDVGEPVATPWYSVEELRAAGIVGLYGYRVDER